ncbi:BrnT family toxin [Methylobacterium gossipiicola]|uniref:BrnT family toxin n=1 Tax=Methylobacterium gossipiicola TaxID=582675 RepID=UPI000B88577C|nr:BrnT family toxin [Methylobacterium gossipiicola]
MDFDWHDEKSDRNLAGRGFGFDFAALIFLGRVLLRADGRQDYGEVRQNALGEIDGDIDHVTFTDRGDVRWIISARRANRRERQRWHASASTDFE